MSESIADLLRTDAELDLLGSRGVGRAEDNVLAGLASLISAIDERPLPPMALELESTSTPARKMCWALAVTAALVITSSGVAAAVSDDPLAPLHYMTNHVLKVGPHAGGHLPGWDIDGSMPITTMPGARLPPRTTWTGGSPTSTTAAPGGSSGLKGPETGSLAGPRSPASPASPPSPTGGDEGASGGVSSPGGSVGQTPPGVRSPGEPGSGGGGLDPSDPRVRTGRTGSSVSTSTTPRTSRVPGVGKWRWQVALSSAPLRPRACRPSTRMGGPPIRARVCARPTAGSDAATPEHGASAAADIRTADAGRCQLTTRGAWFHEPDAWRGHLRNLDTIGRWIPPPSTCQRSSGRSG